MNPHVQGKEIKRLAERIKQLKKQVTPDVAKAKKRGKRRLMRAINKPGWQTLVKGPATISE